jgi:hypothetical protein
MKSTIAPARRKAPAAAAAESSGGVHRVTGTQASPQVECGNVVTA